MLNIPEYQTRRRVTANKNGPLESRTDSAARQYNTEINYNGCGLVCIILILIYCNSGLIGEKINSLLSRPVIPTKTTASTVSGAHIDVPRAVTITHNPKIDWDGCLYESLKPDGRTHIVPPPSGPITLVCCNTTVGVLNIEVHHGWAFNGANRFLDMVKTDFFSTQVGLFRALKNFLVQFGLAGDVEVQKKFHALGNLRDDPQWLPAGPPGREINGVKRFQRGYLAYAGAGVHSRGTQLILAFQDSLYLGGGSPWEVPWGQLFGEASFATLDKIYTGYGEKVSQGKIMNRGVAYLKEEFPRLDYVTRCAVTREGLKD